MTERQKRFCDFYIQTGNGAEAAIKAGYSKKYAGQNVDKLLKNTNIKNYIEEQLQKLEDARIADTQEVLKYLTSVMRGESVAEIVVVEGCGDGYSEAKNIQKQPDEKERLKAAELLGKRYGIFTDRIDMDADLDLHINVTRK